MLKQTIVAHSDGSIVHCTLDGTQKKLIQVRLPRLAPTRMQHSCAAYALAWGSGAILAAGCDKRVVSYSERGQLMQQFDYRFAGYCRVSPRFSRADMNESAFNVACANATGQSVVIGSYDRIRTYNWSTKRGTLVNQSINQSGAWDEANVKEIANMYTVNTFAWSTDGSRLVCVSSPSTLYSNPVLPVVAGHADGRRPSVRLRRQTRSSRQQVSNDIRAFTWL